MRSSQWENVPKQFKFYEGRQISMKFWPCYVPGPGAFAGTCSLWLRPLSRTTHLTAISPSAVLWLWAGLRLSVWWFQFKHNRCKSLNADTLNFRLNNAPSVPVSWGHHPLFAQGSRPGSGIPHGRSSLNTTSSQCQSKAYLSIIRIPLTLRNWALHQHMNFIFLNLAQL